MVCVDCTGRSTIPISMKFENGVLLVFTFNRDDEQIIFCKECSENLQVIENIKKHENVVMKIMGLISEIVDLKCFDEFRCGD